MSFSLIVPIAADKKEYEAQIPLAFLMGHDGVMLCMKAILGLPLNNFTRIYFTLLRTLDNRYRLSQMIRLQLDRLGIDNAEIVVLDEPTSSQPETIYQTLRQCHITGAIFIKDADCTFCCDDIVKENCVAIQPLEDMKWVNPQDKSYVAVDDNSYITNIIEKRIVSHYFSAGGYCFENAAEFCQYYERYKGVHGVYLSHIIYEMLLDKNVFRPLRINAYRDFEQNFRFYLQEDNEKY